VLFEELVMNQLNRQVQFSVALLILFVLTAAAAAAQQKAFASTGGSAGTGFGSGAAGLIGAGDLVEMSVFDTPELSGKLRVSNSGDVILPLVGSLHVAGLSASEVQNLIRQKFVDGRFVNDPQVTVFVAEYATQGVSVLGEVRTPGVYPAFGAHNLVDYISFAGGLTPLAGTDITITRASHPNDPLSVKISSSSSSRPLNNPEILPGDSIFVGKTGLIYVIGDVVRPGGFPMDHDEHLTILQALALAQGTTYAAKESGLKIIRSTPQGHEEISVNLKQILAAKIADPPLQDNDILFVPTSNPKVALKTIETLIPIAASATIYRLP
jgi:polysaccharide biosynthesis/export protein